MTNTEILVRLRDLHGELSSINDERETTDEVADKTVDALGQLVTDVGGLLDRAMEMNDPERERSELMKRIESFESDRPCVMRFLSHVTDVLGMMGI